MSEQNKLSVLNALDEQEIRQLVVEMGIYVRGAVEPWSFDGKSGVSGWIQMLQVARTDSKKMKLTKIKVNESQFGLIDILNNSKELQPISLDCEIVTYGNRSDLILIPEQTSIKVKAA